MLSRKIYCYWLSRKYIFCLCIPKPASRESQNPGAYPGMVLGFIFKLFDVSVWFRTWDYVYSCWYFERERGHCTVRFLWNQWNFELFCERVFFFEMHASEAFYGIAIIEYTFFQWITTFESLNVSVNEKNLQIFPWCDAVKLHSFNILMFHFQS